MCTSIKIQAKTGEVFWGRTMDLTMPLFPHGTEEFVPCVITSIPANIEISSQVKNWQSIYSVIGVGIKDSPILLDGVNEHGLAGDTQVLTECGWAELSSIQEKSKVPMLAEELVSYMLTTCKSVSEVKECFEKFMLLNQAYQYGNRSFQYPLHFSFVDESGDGIVLETNTDGTFKSFDHLNVMTNSPRYDYHQINIRNYIGMSTTNLKNSRTLSDGNTFIPIENGTGYGMFGLPGDYTSPSRFIRSFCLSAALDPFEKEQGMNELYSVFRTVIIPKGLEREPNNPKISDYTRYWSGYNLCERKICVQTGESLAFTNRQLDPTLDHISYTEIKSDK
ncbi:linear amide C-N hydrolase [Enterococcus sp. 22-H-5-01]|uniref:linear amide C-N hydrolase n=1 Tax=Enterococcus sp. 22-H-5-01 TaxID=3418555 RepID=UPI003D074830